MEVLHATKVREGDLARMERVSKQMAGTSTLPAPSRATDNIAPKQDANSAGKAYSSASNKSIIPQNAKNSNDLEAELTDIEKEFIRLFPQNKNPLLKTKRIKKLKSEFYNDKTTLTRKMQILGELNKLKTK